MNNLEEIVGVAGQVIQAGHRFLGLAQEEQRDIDYPKKSPDGSSTTSIFPLPSLRRQITNAEEIIHSLVENESEFNQAMQLVAREFRREIKKEGYLGLEETFSIPPQNFLPSSRTFVAKYKGQVVGTITAILDSHLGLPMEDIYRQEVEQVRSHHKSIAQLTQLAVDKDFLEKETGSQKQKNEMFVFLELFKWASHYCIYRDVDYLCMTINPKHESFYEKIMFFEDIGGVRDSLLRQNAPALGLNLREGVYQYLRGNRVTYKLAAFPPDYRIFAAPPIALGVA